MGHKNELELMGFIKVALQATVFWKGILGKENSVTLSQKEYLTLGNVDRWLIQNGTWTCGNVVISSSKSQFAHYFM